MNKTNWQQTINEIVFNSGDGDTYDVELECASGHQQPVLVSCWPYESIALEVPYLYGRHFDCPDCDEEWREFLRRLKKQAKDIFRKITVSGRDGHAQVIDLGLRG